jgi:hypothetical protein
MTSMSPRAAAVVEESIEEILWTAAISCPTTPSAASQGFGKHHFPEDEGSGLSDDLEARFGKEVLAAGALPAGPMEREVPRYATTEHQVLRGQPLYSSSVLQLTLGESIREMRLSLYINGFSIAAIDLVDSSDSRVFSRTFSPFMLVEKCEVKTLQDSSDWSAFKVTLFRQEEDVCYYFATRGSNAAKECEEWIHEISAAISNVTVSLFPPHVIAVRPVPGVVTTSTRIMAGYLLKIDTDEQVILMYYELHAFAFGEARLQAYRDEWCNQKVFMHIISAKTTVSTRKGAYCAVFGVDDCRFCARTQQEKDLWLRAVSNIKVKLMLHAPDPTVEDLGIFRAAVHEKVEKLQFTGEVLIDPLLTRIPRAPPVGVNGDEGDPEPIEDDDNAGGDACHEGGGEGDRAAGAGLRGACSRYPRVWGALGAASSPGATAVAVAVAPLVDSHADGEGNPEDISEGLCVDPARLRESRVKRRLQRNPNGAPGTAAEMATRDDLDTACKTICMPTRTGTMAWSSQQPPGPLKMRRQCFL